MPVYYCTDRAQREDPDVRRRYTGDRGAVSYGVAKVSIPRSHEVGVPKWWKGQFREDPKKHITLLDTAACGREDFVQNLRTALETADSRDILIFVHGYNVDFQSAAKRVAQMTVDLKFPGRSVLYSWPSQADTKKYLVDDATIDWSVPHLYDFLRLCLTELGATTAHLLAHSMGNRVVVRALDKHGPAQLPEGSTALHHLVCAAADVDGGEFLGLASTLADRARRVTLYASENDKALLASRHLHGYPRAGEAGRYLLVTAGLDREAQIEQGIRELEQRLTQPGLREENPREWARAHHNLGETIGMRGTGDATSNREQTIAHLELALEVFTRDA